MIITISQPLTSFHTVSRSPQCSGLSLSLEKNSHPRQNQTFHSPGLHPRAPAPGAVVNWALVMAGGWAWSEEAREFPNRSVLVTTRHIPVSSCAPTRTRPASSGKKRWAKQAHLRQQTQGWPIRKVWRGTKGKVRRRKYSDDNGILCLCTLEMSHWLFICLLQNTTGDKVISVSVGSGAFWYCVFHLSFFLSNGNNFDLYNLRVDIF